MKEDDKKIKESESEEITLEESDILEEENILEEVLETLTDDKTKVTREKIPKFHDDDELPLPENDKLTTFIDGYLVTLDELDVKILNSIKGKEREDYLREKKAICNEKLIYKVANKLLKFEYNSLVKIDPEELYAAGWHALAKAINTYDVNKGFLFTTYAYRIMENEMKQEIKKIKKKVVSKIDGQKVESLAIHVSMDAPIRNDNKGNDIYVADMLADKAEGPDKLSEREDTKKVILRALDSLDPTEKYVMTYRYGLDRDIVLTQKEIAEKLNQSQANISKIEKTCRLKLRILLKGSLGANWED